MAKGPSSTEEREGLDSISLRDFLGNGSGSPKPDEVSSALPSSWGDLTKTIPTSPTNLSAISFGELIGRHPKKDMEPADNGVPIADPGEENTPLDASGPPMATSELRGSGAIGKPEARDEPSSQTSDQSILPQAPTITAPTLRPSLPNSLWSPAPKKTRQIPESGTRIHTPRYDPNFSRSSEAQATNKTVPQETHSSQGYTPPIGGQNVFRAIKLYGNDKCFQPSEDDPDFKATQFPPGSYAKIELLRKRVEKGHPLWHPEDRTDFSGLVAAIKPREDTLD